MQNLITLVGLANAATLISHTNTQMSPAAQPQPSTDDGDSLEIGTSFSDIRKMCKPTFCDPKPKDECCQRYLNKFCDFTLDNISTTAAISQTKIVNTNLELPSSFRFVAI